MIVRTCDQSALTIATGVVTTAASPSASLSPKMALTDSLVKLRNPAELNAVVISTVNVSPSTERVTKLLEHASVVARRNPTEEEPSGVAASRSPLNCAERGVVTGEGDSHDRGTVYGAVHPRRVSDQLAGRIADIDMPPATFTVAAVEPQRPGATASTPAPPGDPPPHPHLEMGAGGLVAIGQITVDDHHIAAQPEHLLEYLVDAHATVLLGRQP